ncbi:MAG: GNAT family N-acetyltransferase [Verrucomicrobiota bacterium]
MNKFQERKRVSTAAALKDLSLQVSPGLCIRLMQSEDLRGFFSMIDQNREDLRKWLSWVDQVTSIEDISKRYDQVQKSQAEGKSLRFLIHFEGKIIGMLAAKRIDWESLLAELSYCLDPYYRGRGFVTRSCPALISYITDSFGITSFEIRTAIGNHPSARVPQRLGFKPTSILENAEQLVDGNWVDHQIYRKDGHRQSAS